MLLKPNQDDSFADFLKARDRLAARLRHLASRTDAVEQLASRAATAYQSPVSTRAPDVVFVPTPHYIVEAMLKLAAVKKEDIIYDLGSGDGRLVITAAKLYGVKGTGIEINLQRIEESNENAKREGVENLVHFVNQDLFEANFRDATVVTLYLLPAMNLRLRPKLWSELKPGTRIVSHSFDMGDWQAERKIDVDGRVLSRWTIPGSAEPGNELLITNSNSMGACDSHASKGEECIMPDHNFEDLFKARDRLVARLQKRTRRPHEVAPEERQAQLASAAARLQEVVRAKEEAAQRYDDEIRHYAELVKKLETEVAEDQSRAAVQENKAERVDEPPRKEKEDPADAARAEPVRGQAKPRKRAEKKSPRAKR